MRKICIAIVATALIVPQMMLGQLRPGMGMYPQNRPLPPSIGIPELPIQMQQQELSKQLNALCTNFITKAENGAPISELQTIRREASKIVDQMNVLLKSDWNAFPHFPYEEEGTAKFDFKTFFKEPMEKALIAAAKNGYAYIVRYLISFAYINVNAKDENGKTARDLANNQDVINALEGKVGNPQQPIPFPGGSMGTPEDRRNWPDYEWGIDGHKLRIMPRKVPTTRSVSK
jgi:hypothetical protein